MAEADTLLARDFLGSVIEDLEAVATPEDVEAMIKVARGVHVAPSLKGYIVDVAEATRSHPSLQLGMSPRAALALQRASRALAAARGRDYVVPDDLKALARPVLEHRLTPTPEAQLGGINPADALDDVLASIPVPTGR